MKKLIRIAAFLFVLLLAAGLIGLPSLEKQSDGIYRRTVRLHILADSDSAEDQALKLRVRDELLARFSDRLETARTREDAERIIGELLPEIERTARGVLAQAGKDAPVSAELCREYYPTRDYGAFSFPAGDYFSLQVRIGKGEGKNWWCVIYPPLCLRASGAEPENSGYSEEEQALIRKETPKQKVRFFVVDLIGKVKRYFAK